MFQKLLLSLSIFAVLLNSCEKDTGTLGMGIMPSEDILEVRLDSLNSFNFKYLRDNTNDTIRTSQYSLILGSYIDPVFGKIRAEIFAPIYFNNPVIDKSKYQFVLLEATLQLTYNDTSFQYGKNVPQTISMYEFQDSIKIADYKTLEFKPSETLIGTFELKIDTTIDGDSTVHVTMPANFLKKIDNYIRNGSYAIDMSPDSVNQVFGKDFFGIHFKTSFDDASIVKLKDIKIDIKAKIWDNENTFVDTVTQEMIMSDFIDKENFIYKHPLVRFELDAPTTITDSIGKPNQEKVYIQPMKGYKAEFLFPEIERWLDTSKVVINIARLTIPIEKNTQFSPIPSLQLNIYVAGNIHPIASYTSQDIGEKNQYVFYINSFINLFLKYGKSANEYSYEIIAPNNNLYVNRSVLLPKDAKLHITYTKYK